MIDRLALLKDTQRQVKALEKDLKAQVSELAEVGERLREEYDRAFKVGRTAATWSAWLGERVTQAAVAWVLGTVFVRFCEDNGLIGDPFLAGPTTVRLTLAEERTEEFYRRNPNKTARDWLLTAFGEIAAVPVGAALFDERHNALFQIPLSHDAAKDLITFWRRRTETGTLIHDFTDDTWDTRFLGDLYQDLSEDIRKKYALLQTPEFVEEFILDLTLTPAIEEFGYDVVKVIDPTCGSGHFLLGAFRRLLSEWEKNAPDRDIFERISLALDAVHGVDINPYATAIARFRLVIEALRASALGSLTAAGGYIFPLHVATGDALIKHRQLDLFGEVQDELADFSYATENLVDHPDILQQGRYHAVVGNPPYITVKDKTLNELYRELYSACSGKYALSVPFAQRFFELAKLADSEGSAAGFVGQITANSFMKREFGKKLIEEFYRDQVELTYVIDTSGAYIPGHGTPTIILCGRRNDSRRKDLVRTVLGIRGEPSVPEDASGGRVWQAICAQLDRPGSDSDWVSVVDLNREYFSRPPWSLGGGGAVDLQKIIESSSGLRLRSAIASAGITAVTGEDDLYILPRGHAARRLRIENTRPLVSGVSIRDYALADLDDSIWPYRDDFTPSGLDEIGGISTLLSMYRAAISGRKRFGVPMLLKGMRWYEWQEIYPEKLKVPHSICFAFVATHNYFVLDGGGKVFKQSAPVIKFPAGASEGDYLRFLGVLNSSTACFWLKQVSHDKGIRGEGGGFTSDDWERFYEFTGTKLQEFPLPGEFPLDLARELDGLGQRVIAVGPAAVAAKGVPTRGRLEV
ncbi:BREX-2 system adenine-specific DNA-methyltransferase PglX, partial [Frankia canadensis]|uniref:BREX-2 system adenine-specific DNA-methyltransferase PglX n=1 Tax=Frankia canadensis TaxID=1836972 RepID=UPI000C796811